jgi:hypothetical protein
MSRRSIPIVAVAAIAAVALSAAVALAAVTASNGSSVAAVATISPNKLSKSSYTPIQLTVGAKIAAAGVATDDPVAGVTIDFDKNGKLSTKGLPTCNTKRIEAQTLENAEQLCAKSVIGHGEATGLFVGRDREGNPEPPLSFDGKIAVFNGAREKGKPTLLLYTVVEEPVPVSFVITGVVSKYRKQGFGSRVEFELPKLFGGGGALRDFRVSIGKKFTFKHRKQSLISAKCPGKKKLKARTTVTFLSGARAVVPMTQSCKPKR